MTDELKLRRPKPKGDRPPARTSDEAGEAIGVKRPAAAPEAAAPRPKAGIKKSVPPRSERRPADEDKTAAPRPRPRKEGAAPAPSGGEKPRLRPKSSAPDQAPVKPKAVKKAGTLKPKKAEGEPRAAAPAKSDSPRAASAPPKKKEKNLESLGHLLKTKREIHGLTRRDVVVKIKIPLDQLEAIEEGRLSSLPPVFAKGFLRAYANELGLDAEAILEDYRQLTGGAKNDAFGREILTTPAYTENLGGRQATGGSTAGLKVAIISTIAVAVILSLTLALMPGVRYTLGSVVPFLDKVPGFYEETRSAGNIHLSGEEGDPSGEPQTQPEGNPFISDPNRDDADDNDAGGGAPWVAPESVGGLLTLTSQQDNVWVQVEVDDQPTEHVLMRIGQEMNWRARSHIVVTSGQAQALNVTWNSRSLGPLSESGNVAQVRFPRASR